MKQNTGGRGIGEGEMEPAEVWCELGMLVIESRQPYESPKGWKEGPHCTGSQTRPSHHCAPNDNRMCKRKDAITREIRSLSRNNVPVCIEVVLLPECDLHDHHKAELSLGVRGHYVLLEQWKFQVLPKRSGEASVELSSLFQAVKSYLYFSQISAWLNQTHGAAPTTVEYRVSPPAEFCTSTFQENPELHRFPVCSQQQFNFQVTVATLPRQSRLITLPCPDAKAAATCAHVQDTSAGKITSPPAQQRQQSPARKGAHAQARQEVVTSAPPIPPRRRMASPGAEALSGACAAARYSPSSGLLSPRSESPCGATCGSYTNYSDMKWGYEEGGGDKGGGGVLVQSMVEHRDMVRSKTLKEFHSDDSSDCSESSTIANRSQDSPLIFAHPRGGMQPSVSMHALREKTTSPKFYLPYAQPPIERVSSPSSSSDSSQNGAAAAARDAIFSSHRPSPPIDLYAPSRDLTDSLSRKLATKLSFEPLPAFELEAHVSKSVQVELPTSTQCKHSHELPRNQLYCEMQTTTTQCKRSREPPDDPNCDVFSAATQQRSHALPSHLSQRRQAEGSDLSYKQDSMQGNPTQTASLYGACSNGAVTSAHVTNGSTQSFSHDTSHSMQRGAAIQNGATETNGHHSYHATQLNEHSFQVPKTPEKPLRTILSKHLQNVQSNQGSVNREHVQECGNRAHVPTDEERASFRKALYKSSAAVFSSATGLPLQSSPAPIKRLGRLSFDFDENLTCAKAIKNSLSCANLEQTTPDDPEERARRVRMYSASAPASTNSLLGNFEESLLNGRIEPCGAVDGFRVDIGASGSFCPSHVTLPVTAFFFKLSEDNAPSPYLGHVSLESVGKRGYHIPNKGTIQVTLFNPNKTVVKMFVVTYDLADMPPCCTTFLRQRTLYKPVSGSSSDTQGAPHHLRYLIHLRVASTKSRKLYLHSDIRLIFARDKFEYDSRIANYEYRSLTEGPVNPKYSPKK